MEKQEIWDLIYQVLNFFAVFILQVVKLLESSLKEHEHFQSQKKCEKTTAKKKTNFFSIKNSVFRANLFQLALTKSRGLS